MDLGVFAGGELPSLPFTAEMQAMAGTRVLDVLLVLVVSGLLFGVGMLIRRSPRDHSTPATVVSVGVGLIWLFFVNPLFYQFQSVTVDELGVTVASWTGQEKHLDWSELSAVRVDEGEPFPVFSDDTTLVLVGAEGQELAVPRFVEGSDQVAALAVSHIPG